MKGYRLEVGGGRLQKAARLRARLVGRAGRRGGFSLVELVLVLMITATLAAIALPRYSAALARYRVAAAARRVVADLALAQQWARTRSAAVTLTVDTATNSYEIPSLGALNHRGGAYVVRLGQAPYQVKVQSAVFGGDGSITFNGYGIPDSAGEVVVALKSFSAKVSVDATTGRATVQ